MVSARRTPVPGDRLGPSKGERQRRAILDAISALLADHTVAELSVGTIAEAAGLRRSGFYFYFDSKETAIAVAVGEAWEDLDELHHLFEGDPAGGSTLAQVRNAVQAAADVWCRYEHLLIAIVAAKQTRGTLAGLWDESSVAITKRMLAHIESEIEAGRARPVSPDLPGLIAIILEMITTSFYRARLQKDGPEAMGQLVDTLASVMVATLWGEAPDR